VTRVGQRGARLGTWADAQAIAAACVGIALLAGTGLSGLSRWGPAFPVARAGLSVSERRDGDLAAKVEGTAARPAPVPGDVDLAGEAGQPVRSALLDINRADATAFQTLPGVGPTLARRIVEDRALHGPFRTPEDLLRVSGIGAKRYARWDGRIRTAEAP
jgi:competence ComEA-like helix-hairpin-helix protein